MSDTAQEEVRPKVYAVIGDERVEIILPGDMGYDEAKMAKNISGDMSPAEIEDKLMEADPDAWHAVLRVSFMRVDKPFPAKDWAVTNVASMVRNLAEAMRKAARDVPPTSPGANDEPGSEQKTEPETTTPTLS